MLALVLLLVVELQQCLTVVHLVTATQHKILTLAVQVMPLVAVVAVVVLAELAQMLLLLLVVMVVLVMM
jgi:hypothetical protein